MSLAFGSVCSGIGAPEAAWRPLGFRPVFMSEIEAFPRAVLAHHYPEVPLHGDFTTIQAGDYPAIDVLVGGTPCQSFSVAGLRGGMADDRGNLALQFLALAGRLRPRWVVWENVPGVLSSAEGRDFGSFLGGLGELGYGWAYRTLDAQHFGVPQRRRRVFVVGHLGDWRRAAAVLFERYSLSGHPAPSREAGQRVARPIAAGSAAGSGYRNDADTADNLIAKALLGHPGRRDEETETLIALPLRAQSQASHRTDSDTYIAHALRAEGFDASEDGTGRGTPPIPITFGAQMSTPHWQRDLADTLQAKNPKAIAFNITPSNSNKDYNARPSDRSQAITGNGNRPSARGGDLVACDVAETLSVGANQTTGTYTDVAAMGSAVRRLTPRECERLQGFPDDFTAITYRGKPAADGPRYKALGNSMAVPVMRWIGERIDAVEALTARAIGTRVRTRSLRATS